MEATAMTANAGTRTTPRAAGAAVTAARSTTATTGTKKPTGSATHVREHGSILAAAEKRALIWMVARLPRRVNADHLTALGLLAMVGVGASYWASQWYEPALLGAVAGLALNWFGDSLDGTVARVRNHQRPPAPQAETESPAPEAKRADNRHAPGNGDMMTNAPRPTEHSTPPAPLSRHPAGRPRRPAVTDRTVRAALAAARRVALAAALLGGTVAAAAAADLQPRTIAAWDRYVEETERRIAAEIEHEHGDRFLVRDFGDDAAEARREVLTGRIRIDRLETRDAEGERIPVPKGAIHHWLGSALIPDVTLEEVLHALIHAVEPEALQDDVIESRVLARPGKDRLELFLKLRRKQIVTVHYNSEHAAAYTRHRPGVASSRTIATRIAELDDAGTPAEREKPVGRDRGFLWRLNTYWRYQQVDEGVIFEVESLSLSRGIPRLLRWMVSPLVNRTARDVLTQTLASMAEVLSTRAPAEFAGPGARTLEP